MGLKKILARLVSILLIVLGLFNTLLSVQAIFFIYPKLRIDIRTPIDIQAGLVEKALVLYLTMVVDGTYGLVLLLKPAEKIKTIHIVIGFLIFVASIFFVSKTSFTTNPVIDLISEGVIFKFANRGHF